MSQTSLTQGDVKGALIRFALPFLGASLLQFLYGAVDLIVVGQFDDQAGITAVSTGSQVMQAVTNFIIGPGPPAARCWWASTWAPGGGGT